MFPILWHIITFIFEKILQILILAFSLDFIYKYNGGTIDLARS